MNRFSASRPWLALVTCLVSAASALGQAAPRTRPVTEKAFRHPDLYVPEQTQALKDLDSTVAARLRPELAKFGVTEESVFYDARVGRWSSLILKQPLVPGTGRGNRLSWPSGASAPRNDADLSAQTWSALRAYLQAHEQELKVDLNELASTPRVAVYDKGSLIFVYVPRVVAGIPVRDNSIGAAINHGNLVLLGLQKWGEVNAAPTPSISAESARDAVRGYVGATVAFPKPASLEFIPMSNGDSIDYRLAWAVSCKVDGDMGSWEGLVDAANGTLFAFEDRNQYGQAAKAAQSGAPTGVIDGGVYPISNDQFLPGGVEEPAWPMSFVDYTINGVKHYTDVGGNVIPGALSTALNGLFLKIKDDCGVINETGDGGADLGSGPTPTATDCTVPAGHSAGDTKSSRSGYYELNRQIEKAQSHLTSPTDPGAIWLRGQLTAEMNENDICNAFWDGTQVNFFRSAISQGCRNTGEIAAIFDHEWGHGLDNNGVNPSISNPGESIADIYAMLRLDESCVGRGFFTTQLCGGYGDGCIGTPETGGCTGVRDIDYAQHRCDQPHTVSWVTGGFTNAQCGGSGSAAACPGGGGPCGREVHCEGYVMGETAWDLMTRDLTAAPFNYDGERAHEVAARLLYLGAQPVGSWYTCSVGGGCSATGGYLSLLAVDDDNGDLSDGTPHMTAIRAAFERHEIHCATPAPVNSGCDGGPTEAPTITATALNKSIQVNWSAVPNATGYLVYRGDGIDGCNFGRPIIADTAGLSFVDAGLQNGRFYSYSVVPYGASAACSGPMSACVTWAPTAGPDISFIGGPVISGGDGDPFLDNCELDTVAFSISNSGGVDLTNVRITNVTAVTHPASTILTTFPSTIAASMPAYATAQGSFQVIASGLTFNGESDFLVEVTADEFNGSTRSQLVKVLQTESDLVTYASHTFSFETDFEGWSTQSGTFDRVTGSGAAGTNVHLSSSSNLDNACDVVRSPLIRLTDTSTLSMWVRYQIQAASGGQHHDRANVSLVGAADGGRTLIKPTGGHVYDAPDGAPNGTCDTTGQAGWDGTTPNYPTVYYKAAWSAAALNPGGAFTDVPAFLQINYGTDASISLEGFDFDEVTLTDFTVQVPDAHSDDCANATSVSPAGLAVDASGNGVLEVGETAVVSPTWTNTGFNAVALTGTGSAFTGPAGPTYTLTDGTGAYGDIAAGASAACTDCYSVTIDAATRPVTHWDATVTETVDPSSTVKVWTLHVGGSFTDVPSGSGFYPSVETVLHNGVTAGCGDGTTFCPTDTVTRQQMAVFLLKSVEGSDYVPPACVTQAFDDVPCASPFAAWINELASRGVTAGCGGSNYCPTDPTNRQQMAVFLLKTKEGSSYVPPACTVATFGDVPCDSPFAPWIYELVARGVTAGCGSGNYCPTSSVADSRWPCSSSRPSDSRCTGSDRPREQTFSNHGVVGAALAAARFRHSAAEAGGDKPRPYGSRRVRRRPPGPSPRATIGGTRRRRS